jgi:cell division septation protein DedD
MNDHNLDDLIIDDEQSLNKNKIKGILTIVALLIIVLIIAIFLTKITLKEPKIGTQVIDESAEMISPDLKLQPTPKSNHKDSTIEEFEDSNDELSENSENSSSEIDDQLQKPVVKSTQNTESTTQPIVQKVNITDEFEQTKPVHTSKPKPTVKPKPIVKTKPKPTVKPKPKPVHLVSEKYYIQVGSFTQQPSSSYLSVIRNSGFKYTLIPVGSRKKLLIGPYNSRAAVDRVLPKVRDRINKAAFVYKAK